MSSSGAASAPALKLVPTVPPPTPELPEPPAPRAEESFGLVGGQAPPRVDLSPQGAAAAVDPFVERLKEGLEAKRKPLLAIALGGASRVALEGDELRVEFAPEAKHPRESLAKAENQKLLREVCCEVAGRPVGVLITARGNEAAKETGEDEERREQQKLREAAERDPKVQDLLRTFRAQIIDVRREEGGHTE